MNVVPCWMGFAARCFWIVLPLGLVVAAATWYWWPAGMALGVVAACLLAMHRCQDLQCTRIPGAISAPCDGTTEFHAVPETRTHTIGFAPKGLDCRILRSPISGRVLSVESTAKGQVLQIDGELVTCCLRVEGGYRLLGWPCRLQKGFQLDAGEAIGLIPFGGRVTLEFPDCATPKISAGQRTKGGRTIVAIAFEEDLRRGRVISRSDSYLVSLAETG